MQSFASGFKMFSNQWLHRLIAATLTHLFEEK